MKTLELLAPARDYDSGKAAIDHGADAIYIGGPQFGARRQASNDASDIARLVEYARPFGVRVYAALNTLVWEEELGRARSCAQQVIDAGVDALIIQDMAFAQMGLSGVEFHASTQMCNTDPERIAFLAEAGFSRVILERGLTLEHIKQIMKATDVELECFVHGAICVGFSGQCYMSRSAGPRSGNRGECAQPCRLDYDLVNASGQVLMRGKHLMSVQDLDLSEHIGSLIDSGVTSFKIEGRLKDIAYIKNITSHYSALLDRHIAARSGYRRSSPARTITTFEPRPSGTFSRGGTLWMLDGKRAGVASFDTPKAAGEYAGEVAMVDRTSFTFSSNVTLNPGDGICFMTPSGLSGTKVNSVEGDRVFPDKMTGITKGTSIYRNHDHRFVAMLSGNVSRRVIDANAEVSISESKMTIRFTDVEGNASEASCSQSFDLARDPQKMADTIRKQVASSGETIFNVNEVEIKCEAPELPFVPVAILNRLRREALEQLAAIRSQCQTSAEPARQPNPAAIYPTKTLGPEANVVNSLAEKFYRGHGVEQIEPGADLADSYIDQTVMTSAYCIRRELGECLRDNAPCTPLYRQDLYLCRGDIRYRLRFDCDRCLMHVIKER